MKLKPQPAGGGYGLPLVGRASPLTLADETWVAGDGKRTMRGGLEETEEGKWKQPTSGWWLRPLRGRATAVTLGQMEWLKCAVDSK